MSDSPSDLTLLHPVRCGLCQDCQRHFAERPAPLHVVPSRSTPSESTWIDAGPGNRCHAAVHDPDGSVSIPTLPVERAALLKHAARYGLEGVIETAEAELTRTDLASVKLELSTAAASHRRSRFASAPRVNFSADERATIIGDLWHDGATKTEIGKRTGFSLRTISKYVDALTHDSADSPGVGENRRESA